MENNAEQIVSQYYNTVGWEKEGEITEDAKRWEDLREHARKYVSKCRMRVLRHIPHQGENLLDMASGPIQYEEYLEYSKNFRKRYCIDLSAKALDAAQTKIGNHGVFLQGSFFDIALEENFFDCALSLHTIYHIDKDRQEDAVRKLVKVTKPGKPVIIVYGNPKTIVSLLVAPVRACKIFVTKAINKVLQKNKACKKQERDLYFYPHPIDWWERFEDIAHVRILPWRSFGANIQKQVIPNSRFGGALFDLLFCLEERFPAFFVKYFEYPMIILTKKGL